MPKTINRLTINTANGRENHVTVIELLLNPDQIAHVWHQKRWTELAALVEYVQHDVPQDLAQTDPALFRSLRDGITQYYLRGYGRFNLKRIKNFAKKENQNAKIPKRPTRK